MATAAKQSWFKAALGAKAKSADVSIYQEIGLWGVTAKDFIDEVKALGDLDELNLHINSPGGSIFDGWAIYNFLAKHKATKNGFVDGLAASMASVILCACDTVTMPSNAMQMIHRPSGGGFGESDDLRSMADLLDVLEVGIVNTYAAKSKQAPNDIKALMAAETWITADDALKLGFATNVTEPVTAKALATHADRVKKISAHAPDLSEPKGLLDTLLNRKPAEPAPPPVDLEGIQNRCLAAENHAEKLKGELEAQKQEVTVLQETVAAFEGKIKDAETNLANLKKEQSTFARSVAAKVSGLVIVDENDMPGSSEGTPENNADSDEERQAQLEACETFQEKYDLRNKWKAQAAAKAAK